MAKPVQNDSLSWFTVRCLFQDTNLALYEERTILVRACTHDQAIAMAEADAQKYAAALDLTYAGYADSFQLFDNTLTTGTEIFSLIRKTAMSSNKYINMFLDTGLEHRRAN